MSVRVLVESLGCFALPFYHQLVVLDADFDIFLRNPGQNCAEVEMVLGPAGFDNRAEGLGAFARSGGARRGTLIAVEIFEHLIDRPTELIQRLPNIIGK